MTDCIGLWVCPTSSTTSSLQLRSTKLPRNTLPDLYTPDHSVYLLHSKDGWSSPADEAVAAECGDVEETLLRYFGMYNPAAAARRQGVGQYLAQPGR